MRSHGPNPYIDSRVRKLSVSFNILRVYVCVCVYLFMYVHTRCIFHFHLRFFFFSGDNTLPKAIDTLMRCYQDFFVAINLIIRMLVLRACLRDNFIFFRCPLLTFNDLPHFLPLLYLIIDCDLYTHTLSLSLALIRSTIITLSPPPRHFPCGTSLAFPFPIDRSDTLSPAPRDRTIRFSIARVIFIRE